MEFLDAKALLEILREGGSLDDGLMGRYVSLVKGIHSMHDPKRLSLFGGHAFEDEVLAKADRLDDYLDEELRGKARLLIESFEGEEGLLHGDIQPGNIMVGSGELLFIDFDTFSTGRAIFDLGALHRTLLSSFAYSENPQDSFLKLPR